MGRATEVNQLNQEENNISIHALRGEGDVQKRSDLFMQYAFQSTPSVGRATIDEFHLELNSLISIHALRGEGDARSAVRITQNI